MGKAQTQWEWARCSSLIYIYIYKGLGGGAGGVLARLANLVISVYALSRPRNRFVVDLWVFGRYDNDALLIGTGWNPIHAVCAHLVERSVQVIPLSAKTIYACSNDRLCI